MDPAKKDANVRSNEICAHDLSISLEVHTSMRVYKSNNHRTRYEYTVVLIVLMVMMMVVVVMMMTTMSQEY